MKEQRWPGDYETVKQEFRAAYREESKGLAGQNMSLENDYVAMRDEERLDAYQKAELEPSYSMQLDTVGMQPHAREYLERDVNGLRSRRKFINLDGQMIDHAEGIQFSGTP